MPTVQSRPRAGKIALSLTVDSPTGCAILRPALAVKATFVHTQCLPLSACVFNSYGLSAPDVCLLQQNNVDKPESCWYHAGGYGSVDRSRAA